MRALLGLVVLGGLFLFAASWQRDQTARLRDERSLRYGVPAAGETRQEGWSTLVLGGSSGAPPIPAPERPPGVDWEEPASEGGEAPRAVPFQPDYRYEVQPGDVLGVICQRHYGTAKPRLVEAVARYNELASADAIRAGVVLLLPDRELLDL